MYVTDRCASSERRPTLALRRRRRWLGIPVVALSMTALAVAALTQEASASASGLPGPRSLVASVAATPASLPATGGTVAVSGRVEHATSCQLRLLSSQSFPGGLLP